MRSVQRFGLYARLIAGAAWDFVMIIALAGYIGTMVAAFAMLVVVWHHVIGPPQSEAVRQQPRPIGAVARPVPAGQTPRPGGPAVHSQSRGGRGCGGEPRGCPPGRGA